MSIVTEMISSPSNEYGVLQDEEVEINLNLNSSPNDKYSRHIKHTLIPISKKQMLYLVLFQGVGSGAVNFLINFALAYVMYRQAPHNSIPFAGALTCVASDVVVTSFLIPALTGIIGFFLLRNDLRLAKLITPIDRRYLQLPVIRHIPPGTSFVEVIKRSLMFGIAGVIVFAPITLLLIYAITGTGNMTAVWTYIAFKGWWGGLEALVVSPLLAFVVIANADRQEDQTDNSV